MTPQEVEVLRRQMLAITSARELMDMVANGASTEAIKECFVRLGDKLKLWDDARESLKSEAMEEQL